MSFLDLICIPLVLFAGHSIINAVVNKHNLYNDKSLLVKLFYYHLFFSLVLAVYVSLFGGDSAGYWRYPRRFLLDNDWLSLYGTGTTFVYFLTYPFSQVIGLSFWGGTVLFSLFGFGGFICLYLTLKKTLFMNPKLFGYRLFPLILFLPNMHFWSGGVSKDSIIFYALCLFIYSITDVKRNIPGLILSFYLAYHLRPHIALVMLVGFGCALMFTSKGVSVFWRISFLAVSVLVFVLISDSVFSFIGLDRESVESYEDIADIRSQNLSRGTVGSAIDITSLPVPLRMLTFLFRPLFLDAGNFFGLFVSVENLFYFTLMLSVLKISSWKGLLQMPVFLKACFFISISTTYFMSSSLSNLGIIIRQKNMVMFMLMLVFLYLLSRQQYLKCHFPRKRRWVSKVAQNGFGRLGTAASAEAM